MTWRAVIAGPVVVSLALVGCGEDRAATTTTTTSPAFTPQQLSDALLTTDDLAGLGPGWTETQRDVFTTRQPENPSIDPSLWCPAGKAEELVTLAGEEGADVELISGGSESPYIVRQQAWANADVERYLASVKAAVDACSGVTWDDGSGNSYTLAPSPTVPPIGDDSVSWRVTIELTGTTPSMSFTDQTASRFGDVMMVLQGGATPTTGPEASGPNYVLLARGAGDKMAGLVTP